MKRAAACALCVAVALAGAALAGEPADVQFRQPVALAPLADGRVAVANRRSGTVSLVDLADRRVLSETRVGRRLADLAALPDGRLLAVDESAHELLLLELVDDEIHIAACASVPRYPVSVVASADGRRAYVASLWSRRVTIVEIGGGTSVSTGGQATSLTPETRVVGSTRLPFCPRKLALTRGGERLIAADSFGGRLAVIDTASGELLATRELPAHNIRGLAVDPAGEKLLVAHQILNGLAQTTENDVHWGILLINVVRWLDVETVLDPARPILEGSHVHPTGDASTPGGDPAGLAVLADGTVAVTLGGVGRLAWGREEDYVLKSLEIGLRPTAVMAPSAADEISPRRAGAARLVAIADTFADRVVLVDLEAGRVEARISLGPQPEPSIVDRGERLFYDAHLALDGWFSCHSCHTDGHTNGLLADTLGDGGFGASKRVLSLLGTNDTGPWAWDASAADLEGQVRKSIETTLQGEPPSSDQVMALAAYLRSLPPPPALGPLEEDFDQALAGRGHLVFTRRGCTRCHTEGAFTVGGAFDVGLEDERGARRFNPPSLRGVSQQGALLHDNRARALEQVFTLHGHGLDEPLVDEDLRALLEFLRSL